MAYVRIIREEDVKEGAITAVQTKFGRVALTRSEGRILAFQDICTHDDAPLDGGVLEGTVVTCPRHGAQFDIVTGKALRLPATEGIEVYPVRIEEGEVSVELD